MEAGMNESEIRVMEAGREMDVLVAEKVMGWRYSPGWECHIPPEQIAMPDEMWTDWQHDAGEFWKEPIKEHHVSGIVYNGDSSKIIMPQWSTKIADAWKVVEKMHKGQWMCDLSWRDDVCYGRIVWAVDFVTKDGRCESADDESAPLAICRAALLAVMVQGE